LPLGWLKGWILDFLERLNQSVSTVAQPFAPPQLDMTLVANPRSAEAMVY